MKYAWSTLLIIYLFAALATALLALVGWNSLLIFNVVMMIIVLGAPWSVAFLLIGSEMLPRYGAEFVTVFVLPALGIVVNVWLLWRQFRKSGHETPIAVGKTSPSSSSPGPVEAWCYPRSALQGLLGAVVVPCVIFLAFWYLLSMRRGSSSLLNNAVSVSQIVALLNCWVLFFRWKTNRAFLLSAAVIPVLVAVSATHVIASLPFLMLISFIETWAVRIHLSVYGTLLWIAAFSFVYGASILVRKQREATR